MESSGKLLTFFSLGVLSGALLASTILYRPTKGKVRDNIDPLPPTTELNELPGIGETCEALTLPSFDGCIYLDNNATTPIYPQVAHAMEPFLNKYFGNPSSSSVFSSHCRESIGIARKQIQILINAASEDEIFFTSCGSESDNWAIEIALHQFRLSRPSSPRLPEVVCTSIEHPAIMGYLAHLQNCGQIVLKVVEVNEEGFVSPTAVQDLLTTETALVTIMHSNNEIGTIQPLLAISKIIFKFNMENHCRVLFHSDAAQSLGKVVVDVRYLGVDMVTIVGHKFGAPKGIGALYVRAGIEKSPKFYGGGQERGWRAGTENLIHIVGLGKACELAYQEALALLLHFIDLKLKFITQLQEKFQEFENIVKFNGPTRDSCSRSLQDDLDMLGAIFDVETKNIPITKDKLLERLPSNSKLLESNYRLLSSYHLSQLPNTLSVSFCRISVVDLLSKLQGKVACSSGSACHSHSVGSKVSAVLQAIGLAEDYALGTLRLSFGRHTTHQDIDRAVDAIVVAVQELMS